MLKGRLVTHKHDSTGMYACIQTLSYK